MQNIRIISNITNDNHKKSLEELIVNSDHIILVSPFLFEDFSIWINELNLDEVKKIELITSLKPTGDDQIRKVGSLNSFVKSLSLKKIDFTISVNDNLHGKIYLFKRCEKYIAGIITSANLTNSGLSLNHEWGVVIEDEIILSELENQIKSIERRELPISLIVDEFRMLLDRYKKTRQEDVNLGLQGLVKRQAQQISNNKILAIESANNIFLKPIGHSEAPIKLEDQRKFGNEKELYFPEPMPRDIKSGDIIVSFGIGCRSILAIHTVNDASIKIVSKELQELDKRYRRWKYYVYGINHTSKFGDSWWEHDIKIDNLVKEYLGFNSSSKITAVGGQTLGAIQQGKGKLRLDKDFAKFVIDKIMSIELG